MVFQLKPLASVVVRMVPSMRSTVGEENRPNACIHASSGPASGSEKADSCMVAPAGRE
jgi:hypothetical protein